MDKSKETQPQSPQQEHPQSSVDDINIVKHNGIKPSEPSAHSKETKNAGNKKTQTTLQKMFHIDPTEKVKNQKDSTNESDIEDRTDVSSVKSTDTHQSSQQQQQQQQSNCKRFRKNVDGSHFHCLQPKKIHRLPNFLKELGIHNHHLQMEQPQQQQVNDNCNDMKPSNKNPNCEDSLTKKYGKPQEVVGKGAFGVVRISHKTEPRVPGERLYAVKEFKKHNNESQKKYIKRLTSEFCISSSLRHINVIDTLDLLQDTQGNYCEVMEYCAGGDLYSLIVSCGSLEQEEANCFFGQLIDGVKYLHDNGVAHRDLKPENLLLTSSGCLKITDFGNGECFRMAWESKSHLSRGICGSEPYIAPEEYTDEWFDPRLVDIWACGIIYMGMITGQYLWRVAKPFEDYNFQVYLESKKKPKTIDAFQKLNDACYKIMSKIIEPDPKERYTIEQIIQDPWFSKINICFKPNTPIINPVKNTNDESNKNDVNGSFSSIHNSTCGAKAAVTQHVSSTNKIIENKAQ